MIGSRTSVDASDARDHLDELTAQFETLLGSLDRTAVLRDAGALLRSRSGLPVALVARTEGPDGLVMRATSGTTAAELFDGLVVPVGRGLGGKVLTLGSAQHSPDYVQDPSITHHFDRPVAAEDLHGMVAVPIVGRRRVHGVLYGADRLPGRIGDRASAEVEAVARRAAVALDVADQADRATEIAIHEERRRMAIDLHDSVGAMLYAIAAGARHLADGTAALDEVADRAQEIEQRASSAAIALRRSLKALHSTPEQLALPVALAADTTSFGDRTGIACQVLTLSELPPLSKPVVDALAAGVREALLNVAKHASARSVAVTVVARDRGVAVAVADDGRGPERHGPGPAELDPAHSSGLGLESVAVRLERVGGRLHLATNEDGGTTTTLWGPA